MHRPTHFFLNIFFFPFFHHFEREKDKVVMSATLTGKDGNNNFILNILEHQPPSSEEGKDGGFYYIPNFISEQEEEYLIEKIKSSPKPKWRNLQARRSVRKISCSLILS